MHANIVLINGDCTPLCAITWQRAVKLIFKNKAQPFCDEYLEIRTTTTSIMVPKILKLVTVVKNIFKGAAKYCKKNILLRDKYKCVYCGKSILHGYTIDHVHPKYLGGKDCFENVVAACKTCNLKKGNLLLEKSGLSLQKLPHHPSSAELISNKLEMQGVMTELDRYYAAVLK